MLGNSITGRTFVRYSSNPVGSVTSASSAMRDAAIVLPPHDAAPQYTASAVAPPLAWCRWCDRTGAGAEPERLRVAHHLHVQGAAGASRSFLHQQQSLPAAGER